MQRSNRQDECPGCYGYGAIPCPTCNGAKYIIPELKMPSSQYNPLARICSTCDGKGGLTCSRCKGTGINPKFN